MLGVELHPVREEESRVGCVCMMLRPQPSWLTNANDRERLYVSASELPVNARRDITVFECTFVTLNNGRVRVPVDRERCVRRASKRRSMRDFATQCNSLQVPLHDARQLG